MGFTEDSWKNMLSENEELKAAYYSMAVTVKNASELLVKKSIKIAKLETENKELKIEIQNLHQFIKKHLKGDIYE